MYSYDKVKDELATNNLLSQVVSEITNKLNKG